MSLVITKVEPFRTVDFYEGAKEAHALASQRHGMSSPTRTIYKIHGYSSGHFGVNIPYKGKWYHAFRTVNNTCLHTIVVEHGPADNKKYVQVPDVQWLRVLNPTEAGPKKILIKSGRLEVKINDAWAWKHIEMQDNASELVAVPFCVEAYEMTDMEISRLPAATRASNPLIKAP